MDMYIYRLCFDIWTVVPSRSLIFAETLFLELQMLTCSTITHSQMVFFVTLGEKNEVTEKPIYVENPWQY